MSEEKQYDFVEEGIRSFEKLNLPEETIEAIRYFLNRDFIVHKDVPTDPVKMAVARAAYQAAKGLKQESGKAEGLKEDLEWTEKRIKSYEIEITELTKGFHKQ